MVTSHSNWLKFYIYLLKAKKKKKKKMKDNGMSHFAVITVNFQLNCKNLKNHQWNIKLESKRLGEITLFT